MLRKVLVAVLALTLFAAQMGRTASAAEDQPDFSERLNHLFAERARWLLSEGEPPALEPAYMTGVAQARWALEHEQGKIRYVRQWVERRGVKMVEVKPSLYIRRLSGDGSRARFYVGQTLQLGYVYPGETSVNRFGVGSRHVVELREQDGAWRIHTEWYSDPLGDASEVPDVVPTVSSVPATPVAPVGTVTRGYNREAAVSYADRYCGLAWGCGNDHRYNLKQRDFSGVGGDCTNFASQVLREGGLRVPRMIRVGVMASYLQYSGRGRLVARGTFRDVWKRYGGRMSGPLQAGDLVAYQLKSKMEHFAIVTGFDTRGYAMVNSHTADRYHVPFDLGWDRRTVYWLFHVSG